LWSRRAGAQGLGLYIASEIARAHGGGIERAMDVESALADAHFEVCGCASTEAEALLLADSAIPDFAVVDVDLARGWL
jgi:AmiR/NasT family two-component response regulator